MANALLRDDAGEAGVLAHRGELGDQYRSFLDSIWAQPQPSHRVLQLCQLRIAWIHGSPAFIQPLNNVAPLALTQAEQEALQSGRFDGFESSEQVALEAAELMPFAHHQVSDELVARCEQAFGEAGTVNLLVALAFLGGKKQKSAYLSVRIYVCLYWILGQNQASIR